MRRLAFALFLALAACGASPSGEIPVLTAASTTTAGAVVTSTGNPDTAPTSAPATTYPTTSAANIPTTTPEPVTTLASDDYDPSLQSLVDLAIADLAARLSVDPGSIGVAQAEAVVWPDGSLGCPQPGMVYTQVQVEGARIVLQVSGVAYPYHSGGGRLPFLCEKG